MAILVGAATAAALNCFRTACPDWKLLNAGRKIFAVLCLLFGLYSVAALTSYAGKNLHLILFPERRSTVDYLAHQLLARYPGKRPLVLNYRTHDFTAGERLYWDMVGTKKIEQEDELKAEIARGSCLFVMTSPSHFDQAAALRPPSGYLALRPQHERKQWITLLSYETGDLTPGFVPRSQDYCFRRQNAAHHVRLERAGTWHDIGVRVSAGPRSSLIVPIPSIEARRGSKVS